MSDISGVIVINKPGGWTSQDVVSKLRGILHERKIGHSGTLDPMATGVLPCFIGSATGAISLLPDTDKEYVAGIRLGITTDTQDITGTVLSRSEVSVDEEAVRKAVSSMVGEYDQLPPMYSAKKVAGRRLYEYARQGETVERTPVRVHIYAAEILTGPVSQCTTTLNMRSTQSQPGLTDSVSQHAATPSTRSTQSQPGLTNPVSQQPRPDYLLRVSCSSGTYIRTLIHDIGQDLGTGAVMTSLVRTAACGFSLEESYTLEGIAGLTDNGRIQEALLPTDELFQDYAAVHVPPPFERFLLNGNRLELSYVRERLMPGPTERLRVYDSSGRFTALYECAGDCLKPLKMFSYFAA